MAAAYRLLSVLMPVYNEARTLRTMVGRVLASQSGLPLELVAVDDCSTDRSWTILRELAASDARIKPLRHARNQGKAAAVRTAIAAMQGDVALIQDADLEYDPRDYPVLLAPILEGKADAVFGSRFAFSGQRRVLLFWHAVANRILTTLTNMLLDLNLSDMETCYKVVRADILRRIPLRAERFGLEPELTSRLAQWNIRIYEVPISYHGRTVAEGKKIGFRDAVEALWTLLKCSCFDRRFTTHNGYYLLQSLRRSRAVNRWIYQHFARHVGSRVLETGCGIGNFTEFLLPAERLVCMDADEFYAEMTSLRFGHLENVCVRHGDLCDPALHPLLAAENCDTIVCHNLLEHRQDDAAVLKSLCDVLAPGGRLVILVPAHGWLYGPCDQSLGHRRRYTAQGLRRLLEPTGLQILHLQEFNRVGAWGWWINKALGRANISAGQIRLFRWLLPLVRVVDACRLGPGLSLLAIVRKPATEETARRS